MRHTSGMRLARRALAVTLLVLCGALAALLFYRSRRPHVPLLAPAASSGVPGNATADASALQRGAIPTTLPDVRMPTLSGGEQSLRDWLGHPLIVNFWATWCGPCRREMPLLQQLWTQNQSSGLNVVGIAVDSREAVEQYLQHTRVGYPLLVGEDAGSAAVERFGIEPVLPFSVFADAKGQIVAVKIGELHSADARYIVAAVEKVTEGRETLPQARAAIAEELRQLAVQRAKQAVQSGT